MDDRAYANPTHAAPGEQPGHKVDGGLYPPNSPTVDSVAVTSTPAAAADTYGAGEKIRFTVTFSEAVEVSASRPHFEFSLGGSTKQAAYEIGTGAASLVFVYTVQAGDSDSDGISIGDHTDTIKLDAGEYIRAVDDQANAALTHAAPGAQSGHKVDGGLTPPVDDTPPPPDDTVTEPVNGAPVFAEAAAARSVAENAATGTAVGAPVSATDPDGDAPAYALEGADAAVFAIEAATGQIRTKAALDHESKAVYSVRVRAADGRGGEAAIDVSIRVTDVDEQPETPGAPRVLATPGSSTSLNVLWEKPGLGGGPDITGYDVQYRKGGSGPFTAHPHRGAGTRTAIAGLEPGTSYQVRVRALNGETPSEWSAPGAGSTHARTDGLDRLARAWLARFARATAEHVSDAVVERMRGGPGSSVVLGGQGVLMDSGAESEAAELRLADELSKTRDEWLLRGKEAPLPHSREVSLGDLLLASSFRLASAEHAQTVARWSVWGRGAKSGFESAEDALSLDGEVVTATLGLDYEWERWLFGVAFSRSIGEGSFRLGGTCRAGCAGEANSTMSGVHPYVRYEASENFSAWGMLGHGLGEMSLMREGESELEMNTGMEMAALGWRGVVLSPSNGWGVELAVRSDFLYVSARSGVSGGLPGVEAEANRFRLLLEGSRETAWGHGSLTPSLEVGLRLDGGDADKGGGVELGGGVRYRAPSIGLTLDVRARGLIAHEASGFEEWGLSASLRIDPGEEGRGLSVRAGSSWGAAASGADRIWSGRVTDLSGRADPPGANLDAEVGYGLDLWRGLLTPYTGMSLNESGGQTWRAGARWKLGPDFDVALEASITEPADEKDPESGLLLRGSRRW